jgi:hypothetical protein
MYCLFFFILSSTCFGWSFAFKWVDLEDRISLIFSRNKSLSWTAWFWKWSCYSHRATPSTRQRNSHQVRTLQQHSCSTSVLRVQNCNISANILASFVTGRMWLTTASCHSFLPSKVSGHCIYHHGLHKKMSVLSAERVSVPCMGHRTNNDYIHTYGINYLVFVIETGSIQFTARTNFLNVIQVYFDLSSSIVMFYKIYVSIGT